MAKKKNNNVPSKVQESNYPKKKDKSMIMRILVLVMAALILMGFIILPLLT